MRPGMPELIVILIIVILLFGAGRIGKLAGEMGKGIRSFREGLKGDSVTSSESADEKSEEVS